MNFDLHPITFLKKSLPLKREVTLELSRYRYEPQSLLDNRTVFSLEAQKLTEEWLKEMIENLLPDEELAIHSKINIDGKFFHIPMIDYDCEPNKLKEVKDIMGKLLPLKVSSSLSFYNSGRSLHAYGAFLLKPGEWVDFKGRLLLCNYPGEEPIVDGRWIGHRLISGYSSLRLSCNTSYYKGLPFLV